MQSHKLEVYITLKASGVVDAEAKEEYSLLSSMRSGARQGNTQQNAV